MLDSVPACSCGPNLDYWFLPNHCHQPESVLYPPRRIESVSYRFVCSLVRAWKRDCDFFCSMQKIWNGWNPGRAELVRIQILFIDGRVRWTTYSRAVPLEHNWGWVKMTLTSRVSNTLRCGIEAEDAGPLHFAELNDAWEHQWADITCSVETRGFRERHSYISHNMESFLLGWIWHIQKRSVLHFWIRHINFEFYSNCRVKLYFTLFSNFFLQYNLHNGLVW